MPSSNPSEEGKRITEDQLTQITIGEVKPHDAPITLVEYDPAWPRLYAREAQRIRSVLALRALQVDHIGSTSVPGLIAKPIIDILLVVADSANEASYAPDLEKVGYVLRIREPEWHQHRTVKGPRHEHQPSRVHRGLRGDSTGSASERLAKERPS